MTSTDIWYLSGQELLSAYRSLSLSPVEVTTAILERIQQTDGPINAFITVDEQGAMEAAQRCERAYLRSSETPGALEGIPVSFKDLTATRGVRTTSGSQNRSDWIPTFDSPLVERSVNAGAIMLGKTNTPEHGWKAETTSLVGGTTRNPWNLELTPGGSSGGAAAAVAMGYGPLAQGSDGAGSVRIPAAFSGVFGHKPSYGLLPHFPVSMIGNLSHNGPLSRTVRDAALWLDVMKGADSRDPHSWSNGTNYTQLLDNAADSTRTKLRIGVLRQLPFVPVEPAVAGALQTAIDAFRGDGCEIVELDWTLPDPYPLLEMIWAGGNAANALTQDENQRALDDPGRSGLIALGERASAAELALTMRKASEYADAVRAWMANVDVVLAPVVPCGPFAAGQDQPGEIAGVLHQPPLGWAAYTSIFNISGSPAASVPCGTHGGIPTAVQIIGQWRDDGTVLCASQRLEQLIPWDSRHPA